MKITDHTVVEMGALPADIDARGAAFDAAVTAILAVFPEARLLVMINVNGTTSVVSDMGSGEIAGHIVRHLGQMEAVSGGANATHN
jgi:hypothetical protein